MNKKYLLFYGHDYYPSGGWEDFKGQFDSINECKAALLSISPTPSCEWSHIVYKRKIIIKALSGKILQKDNLELKDGWIFFDQIIGEE